MTMSPDQVYFSYLTEMALNKGRHQLTRKDILANCPALVKDFLQDTSPQGAVFKYLLWQVQQCLDTMTESDDKLSVHDALFENIMTVFDLLSLHKPFIALALQAPSTILSSLPFKEWSCICQTILENAHVNTSGPKGFMRTQAMQLLMAALICRFIEGDTDDQAMMAFIDQKLRQAGKILGFLGL